jgi:hypothetical protein
MDRPELIQALAERSSIDPDPARDVVGITIELMRQ